MRVQLYSGSLALVRKSGVGKAVEHQRAMLERCGVDVTDHSDAEIVHCNTVFPDSWLAAHWARLRGRKVVYYGHSTMEDFRNSFRVPTVWRPCSAGGSRGAITAAAS